MKAQLLGAWAKLVFGLYIAAFSALSSASSLPVNTRLGGDFTLPSTRDAVDSLSDLQGKVVLLNFGYTSCPDICPMVVARMTQLLRQLGDARQDVEAVFVTFDPERDTLEHLRAYLAYFDERLIGFSGTPEQTRKVAKQYGVVYLPRQDESALGTLYAHSDFIYLLDRQGRVRALFATDKSLPDMVDDVRSLLSE